MQCIIAGLQRFLQFRKTWSGTYGYSPRAVFTLSAALVIHGISSHQAIASLPNRFKTFGCW